MQAHGSSNYAHMSAWLQQEFGVVAQRQVTVKKMTCSSLALWCCAGISSTALHPATGA